MLSLCIEFCSFKKAPTNSNNSKKMKQKYLRIDGIDLYWYNDREATKATMDIWAHKKYY